VAITLCAPDERHKLRAVEKLTRTRLGPDDGYDPEAPGHGRRARGHRAGGPEAPTHATPPAGDAAKPKRRRRRRQERRRAA